MFLERDKNEVRAHTKCVHHAPINPKVPEQEHRSNQVQAQQRDANPSRFVMISGPKDTHFPFRKWVCEKLFPLTFISHDFLLGEETVVQHCIKSVAIHVLADKNNFLPAITVLTFPYSVDMCTFLRPMSTWYCCPEISSALVTADRTCL